VSKTHYKRLLNPDYIGAYSLPEGEDLTVTIDYVQREEVTGAGGKKDECSVAHLVGEKPMILNATNSKTIAKLYGPYIEDWAGKPITLFASTTKLAGETVVCLRIRPKVAPRAKPAITEARLTKAIEAIKGGTYDRERLEASFALSAAQIAALNKALQPETEVAHA
jgi:hypothetical protein